MQLSVYKIHWGIDKSSSENFFFKHYQIGSIDFFKSD